MWPLALMMYVLESVLLPTTMISLMMGALGSRGRARQVWRLVQRERPGLRALRRCPWALGFGGQLQTGTPAQQTVFAPDASTAAGADCAQCLSAESSSVSPVVGSVVASRRGDSALLPRNDLFDLFIRINVLLSAALIDDGLLRRGV